MVVSKLIILNISRTVLLISQKKTNLHLKTTVFANKLQALFQASTRQIDGAAIRYKLLRQVL
jgi:hypothetical protein